MSSSTVKTSKKKSIAYESQRTLDKYDKIASNKFALEQEKSQQELLSADLAALRDLKGELDATDWMFDKNCGSGSTSSLVSK